MQRSRLKFKGLPAFLRQALWPRCFPKIAKLPLCEAGSDRSNPVPKSTLGVEAQRCSNTFAASAVGSPQKSKFSRSEAPKGLKPPQPPWTTAAIATHERVAAVTAAAVVDAVAAVAAVAVIASVASVVAVAQLRKRPITPALPVFGQ